MPEEKQTFNIELIKAKLQNINVAAIKPYLMDTKTLGALALVGFALYTIGTELPGKMDAYFKAKALQEQAKVDKENFEKEKTRIQSIAKALESVKSSPVIVAKGVSPEIAVIDAAQRVVDLAEANHNIFLNLNSVGLDTIVITDTVNIPFKYLQAHADPAAADGAAAPAEPGSEGEAAPPEPPPPPAGGSGGADKIEVQAYRYNLEIQGSFANLAEFIYQINSLPYTAMIQEFKLTPTGATGPAQSAEAGSEEGIPEVKANVKLTMTFLIPWIQSDKEASELEPPPEATPEPPAPEAEAGQPPEGGEGAATEAGEAKPAKDSKGKPEDPKAAPAKAADKSAKPSAKEPDPSGKSTKGKEAPVKGTEKSTKAPSKKT